MALLRLSDVITAVTLLLNAVALLSTSSRPQHKPTNSDQLEDDNRAGVRSKLMVDSASPDKGDISRAPIDPLCSSSQQQNSSGHHQDTLPVVSRVGDLLRAVRSVTVFLLAWNAAYLALMLFVFS
jgi:hypothetical protein